MRTPGNWQYRPTATARVPQQRPVSVLPRVPNVVSLAGFGTTRAQESVSNGYTSPEAIERAAINPNRPTIRATSAERDAFLKDRLSILARYPNYIPGPASDPVFIITDQVASPTVVLEASPPPLLGAVGTPQPRAVRDPVTAARTPKPDGRRDQFGAKPMGVLTDFWNIAKGSFDFDPSTPGIFGDSTAGGVATTADWLGGLYQTYQGGRIPSAPANILPPYVNPSTRVSTTNVVPIRTGVPSVGCISQRDIQIAAVAGTTPEMVDLVLKLGRRNKRRRRMLTKSDIGDISTMRQILGGGEAFKLWLAKATR